MKRDISKPHYHIRSGGRTIKRCFEERSAMRWKWFLGFFYPKIKMFYF